MLRAARLTLLAAVIVAAAALLPAAAGGYVLDRGTGPFTNPPVGGVSAVAPLKGNAVANPLVSKLWAASVRYWGGVPKRCTGGVTINDSTLDEDAEPGDDTYSGWVYDSDPCTMILNVYDSSWPITAETAYVWCTVITHEAGHMYGLGHSPNKNNIMSGDWIPDASPECNRFTTDGTVYRPKIDDPYYDAQGRRRTTAERVAYERAKVRAAAAKRRDHG